MYRKSVSIILPFLFIILTIYSGMLLWNLPTEILESVGAMDSSSIAKANSKAYWVYLFVVLNFSVGLLYFVTVLTNNRQIKEKNIIYVEKQNVEKNQAEDDFNIQDELEQKVESVKSMLPTLENLSYSEKLSSLLNKICSETEAVVGVLYEAKTDKDTRIVEMIAGYAFHSPESKKLQFEFGEGLVGQVAASQKKMTTEFTSEPSPEAFSGLGKSFVKNLLILPLLSDDKLIGVIELGYFNELSELTQKFVEQMDEILIQHWSRETISL